MLTGILTFGLLVCLAGIIYPFPPFRRRWRALAAGFALFLLLGYVASGERTERAGEASPSAEVPPGETDASGLIEAHRGEVVTVETADPSVKNI